MNALLSPLKELADYEEIIKNRNKESGTIQITGCVNSQKTHLMYALSKGVKYNLVVFSNDEKAKQAYEEYKFLDENTYYYPARDLLFYHADIKGKYLQSQRMEVIRAILECDKSASITVITTMDAFLDGVIGPKEIETQKLTLSSGDVLEFGKVQEQLVKMGYERETQIESQGQFAVRGGILDVFPLTDELPVRIELWGDEIDSIRTFDVESQRSIENLEKVTIYPTGELITDETKSVSFLEYFNRKESLLLLDEPIRLLEQAKETESEYQKSRENRQEAGMEESADELLVFEVEEIIEKMNQYSSVAFTTLESKCGTFHVRRTYSLQTKGVNPYNNSFEMLTLDLKRLKRNGYRVI